MSFPHHQIPMQKIHHQMQRLGKDGKKNKKKLHQDGFDS
jgi:hypothetical protein